MSPAVEAERRAHPRHEVALPATVTRVGGRALEATGSTLDLSEGGAQVSGAAGFSVGDVVVVSITGDGIAVANQGLVVGASPAGDLHVAFKSLDDDAVVDLRKLLELA
jgi:hypothetical protein